MDVKVGSGLVRVRVTSGIANLQTTTRGILFLLVFEDGRLSRERAGPAGPKMKMETYDYVLGDPIWPTEAVRSQILSKGSAR